MSHDLLSFTNATKTIVTPKLDGKDISIDKYTSCYLARPNRIEDQKVDIYIPKHASKDSPILLLVDNSGWISNSYENNRGIKSYSTVTTEKGEKIVGNYSSTTDAIGVAISKGYVVVSFGARSRNNGMTNGKYLGHSPATIVDTKAVIRYLRYNKDSIPAGDTENIIISGTSGGGALSTLIAASGNHKDYYPYLYEVGAAGIIKNTDGSYSSIKGIGDNVYAVIAWCPITDLGHACAAYEWQYYDTRKSLYEQDLMSYTYTNDNDEVTTLDNDKLLSISNFLRNQYEEYFNNLKLKDENGEFITTDTLASHIEALMKREIDLSTKEYGIEKMKEDIYSLGIDIPWLTFDTSESYHYDYVKHLEWITRTKTLKVPSAFSNYGLFLAKQNEDTLFGSEEEEYCPFNIYSWEHDERSHTLGLPNTSLNWKDFLKTDTGKLLLQQIKMTNAIDYLREDGSDVAPYWYVRYGMRDRDSSFAVETTLYYSAFNNKNIKDLNFGFAWLQPHAGDYDIPEAYSWLSNILR